MDKFFTGLGVSLLIFGSFLVFQRNNPNRISFAKDEVGLVNVETHKKLPVRITIPSLEIDLPVIESEIKDGKWEVTNEGVSYLRTSPVAGEIGNSVLYGHNWTNLLGDLINIRTGETITIHYSDQSSKDFIVALIQEVKPNDVSILNETKDARITLYTCSGFLDSKRFVVVAKPS